MTVRQTGAGFTLVEVLIALTILSLVLTLTVTGLRTLGNTQAAMTRTIDRVDEVRTVSSFLRDTMEAAVLGGGDGETLVLGGGGGGQTAYFKVAPGEVVWKSTILFGEAYGGSYFLRVAKEGGTLVLRWQEPMDQREPGNWDKASSRIMVENLEQFEVFVRPQVGDDWIIPEEPDYPPLLVRMQIKSSGRNWPELIMPVQR
mgnify:CR=1 FL=1